MATTLDVAELRATTTGRVLDPTDNDFVEQCSGYNLAEIHRPDVVVIPLTTQDVVHAVQFAEKNGLTVQVQATGHGSGMRADGGMLVNTRALNAVSIDPVRGTARVGAGAKWSQVIDQAFEHGLAPLNGSSVTVGVVGYTLGGGMGPMARTYGFAADHVRHIQLVTAQGKVVEVDEHNEPDLFWGLRGGKCALGVVTELEFDLMPISHVYGGAIFFPGDLAPDLLHAYRQWIGTMPDSVTSSIALLRLPDLEIFPEPLRGKLSVHLRYVHVGDMAQGERLLAPMRAVGPAIVDLVERMPYTNIGAVHQDPPDPMPGWDDSVLLSELPLEAINALLATAGPDVESPLILAEIRAMGGALATQPRVENAVGGRGAAFSVTVVGPYPPPLQQAVAGAGASVLGALAPWKLEGKLINFQGLDTTPTEVSKAWAPDVAARLRSLEQTWDPHGRFEFGYAIA